MEQKRSNKMNFEYKHDWEEAKERYKLWWEHEYFGRCALWVTSPLGKAEADAPPPPPEDPVKKWFDFEYIAESNEYGWKNTFFGGESFPKWNPGHPGWASMPSFLGADFKLDDRTGWHDPVFAGGELKDRDYKKLKIEPENKWWKLHLEMLEFSADFCRGKAVPETGAFGGCGDTLAALRSTEKLLFDVMDNPDAVRDFDMRLMELWIEAYEIFYGLTKQEAQGSTCWFPLWAPGKFYAVQNDFAYMISPESFQKIFLPTLEKQTQYLDHAVYHVDGVGNFNHVPALCEIPGLQALQILPGTGKPSPLHYMETLQYVQSRGKNLHITIKPEEVETALRNLSARGLFIHTSCRSRSEAELLLENCKKWSVDG